jgi:hypothetical protein
VVILAVSTKVTEFHDQLSDFQFLKNSAPWSYLSFVALNGRIIANDEFGII